MQVASRFEVLNEWLGLLRAIGFDLVECDETNSHFVLLEFVKSARKPLAVLPDVRLRPCIYKKR